MIDWVCDHWREPGAGIWEVRGGARPFLYSRLMCWIAIDRGLHLARHRSFPAPRERWRQVRDEIYGDIYEGFWSEDLGSFVQYEGAKAVDASALLMPIVKFIGPKDPRWLSTLQQINQRLVADSLVYRYQGEQGADSGFSGQEGTFSICSFWYVECLARCGDLDQARLYFEKTLSYANHLAALRRGNRLGGPAVGEFSPSTYPPGAGQCCLLP